MADIVVFDTTQTGEKKQRQFGMKLLGDILNSNFMNPALSADQVVNNTIQTIISNYPAYKVTYKGDANIMSIDNAGAGIYIYQPGPPPKKVKLKGKKDEDNPGTDVMTISLSEGNADLLLADNYLTKILDDLDAPNPSLDFQKYLLGTITFRRCR
jgi:hypothetical protein